MIPLVKKNSSYLQMLFFQPETILDKDKRGQNALHYCAENQNLNCIEQIIEADPNLLNQTDEEGYTPLHLAVISGNSAIVKFLISKGANVNAVDNEKHSAIHWATGKKNVLNSQIDRLRRPLFALWVRTNKSTDKQMDRMVFEQTN